MTIGLFINSLTGISGYEEAVWLGVTAAARNAGVRVITFAGGALEFSAMNPFEKTRNIIYEMYSPEVMDGLIVCGGSLGNGVSPEKFIAFCERFSSKPIISVGSMGSKFPCVLVDNDLGMQNLVLHLVRDHRYKRIACITGPKGNVDADRRRAMYERVLGENGLPVDEKLIFEGDFNNKSGYEAVMHWFKKEGLKPDAIVASNDNMAFGAIDALQELGISVPYSVAVTGFDDLAIAATATPPLTTVNQPIYSQGYKAFDLLLKRIKGETPQFEVLEKPSMVCRQSCGCLPASVVAYSDLEKPAEGKTVDLILDHLSDCDLKACNDLSATAATIPGSAGSADKRIRSSVESLVSAFVANDRDDIAILESFNSLLNGDIQRDIDPSRWNGAVNILRHLGHSRENLLHRIQAMIGESEKQRIFRRQTRAKQDLDELIAAERELLTSFNLENLKETMMKCFTRLGIDGAVLCLFDNPAKPLDSVRIVTAFRNGVEVDFPSESFSPRQIVPPSVRFTASPDVPLIVATLYYRHDYLGYIVYENSTPKGTVYESFTGEISAAIEGTLLIERVLAAEQQIGERSKQIEQLVRPMLESINSITKISAEQQDEVGKLGSLNRKSMQALGGMAQKTESLASMLEKTGALVSDINSISEVINVVAINASIEAAHVGKTGAGFAVIAGEVRKLAGATRKNSEEISGFLSDIGRNISGLSGSNKELSDSFGQLAKTVQETVSSLEAISSRMESLNLSSTEILSVMNR